MRSSMKTSRIKLLMIFAPTGAYERDHRTTPEVVNTSNVSSMAESRPVRGAAKGHCTWVVGCEGTLDDEGPSLSQMFGVKAAKIQRRHDSLSSSTLSPSDARLAHRTEYHCRYTIESFLAPKCSAQALTTRPRRTLHHVCSPCDPYVHCFLHLGGL